MLTIMTVQVALEIELVAEDLATNVAPILAPPRLTTLPVLRAGKKGKPHQKQRIARSRG
jgi:hypothetical protein